MAKETDYSKKVWEMFTELKVLDSLDKDGEECLSEIDDFEGDEEAEGEGEDLEFIDYKDLTEEERKELEAQGLMFMDGEGEDEEAEGEGEEEVKAGDKRDREDGATKGDSNKRQKTTEE